MPSVIQLNRSEDRNTLVLSLKTKHSGKQRRFCKRLSDTFCEEFQRKSALHTRNRRRQRALPKCRTADKRNDKIQQAIPIYALPQPKPWHKRRRRHHVTPFYALYQIFERALCGWGEVMVFVGLLDEEF